MIKTIALKEIRENIISVKTIIFFVLIVLLFIINGIMFSLNYKKTINYNNKLNEQNIQSLESSSKSLLNLLFLKQTLFFPPSNMSFISEAEEILLPNAIDLGYFEISTPKIIKKENPYFFSFISVDWNNIVLFFISFMTLVLSYNSFSGEKTDGTLKLILTNNISKWKIVIGKSLGVFLTIILPLITGVIINLLIINLSGAFNPNVNAILKILLFIIISGLFILLNILFVFYISCKTSSPSASLSVSLLVWVVLAIIIPNVSWIFSKKTSPVSSISEVNVVLEQIKTNVTAKFPGGNNMSSDWINKPPDNNIMTVYNYNQELTSAFDNVWNNYYNSLFNQIKKGVRYSSVSPYSLFKYTGDKISDNGVFGFIRFYNEIRNYQTVYKDFIINYDKKDGNSYHLMWNNEWNTRFFMSLKPVNSLEIPKFEYKQPSFTETLDECKYGIIFLILWNILLFAIVFTSFVKYDVR